MVLPALLRFDGHRKRLDHSPTDLDASLIEASSSTQQTLLRQAQRSKRPFWAHVLDIDCKQVINLRPASCCLLGADI
jgi:hypothetical protein